MNNSNYTNVWICFNDIRDAVTAFGEIELVNPNWSAHYITQTEYVSGMKVAGNGLQEPSSFHDGQLVFVARFTGLNNEFTVDGLYDIVTELAKKFGDIIGVREMDVEGTVQEFRVEFCQISAAKRILSRMTEESPAVSGVGVSGRPTTHFIPNHH